MADKTPKAVYYAEIAAAIDGDERSPLPKFPRRYYVDETSPGIRLYMRETDEKDVIEYVHELCLANEILGWIKSRELYAYAFDLKSAVETARVWRATTKPVGKIKSVCWLNEEGLTFRRLPWDKCHKQTPVFNEMFSRISNARALKAFIGSLFFEESDMQQYVFLHGAGRNGKGALTRFLHKVLGNAYSSQVPPLAGDRFWTSMIIGKRLVVYPDCNNQTFWASGLFKSLTGGDPVRIEQKMQQSGTAIMTAKHMPVSNERPNISSEEADQRRIIYCEMGPVNGDADPRYGDKLWDEGGSFLNECIKIYQRDCADHGSIPVKNDQLGDWISTVEEELEIAFEKNFSIERESYLLPKAFQSRLQEIWPRNRKVQLEFIKWLERTHGIRKKTANALSGTPKVYFGLKMVFEGQLVDTSQNEQQALQESIRMASGRQRDGSQDS